MRPGYCFWTANNIRSFKAKISSDTSPENREHAFQFDLRCLRTGYKCDRFSDLMPAAWAAYEEDAGRRRSRIPLKRHSLCRPCPILSATNPPPSARMATLFRMRRTLIAWSVRLSGL